jgi:hypothetical protein
MTDHLDDVSLADFDSPAPRIHYIDQVTSGGYILSAICYFILIAGFWASIVLIDLRDFQEFPSHPIDVDDNVTVQFRHVVRSESPISGRDFLLSLRFKLRSRDPITLQSEVRSFLSLHDSKSIWTTTRATAVFHPVSDVETATVCLVSLNERKFFDTFTFIVTLTGRLNAATEALFEYNCLSPNVQKVAQAARVTVSVLVGYATVCLLGGERDAENLPAIVLGICGLIFCEPWALVSEKARRWRTDAMLLNGLRFFFVAQLRVDETARHGRFLLCLILLFFVIAIIEEYVGSAPISSAVYVAGFAAFAVQKRAAFQKGENMRFATIVTGAVGVSVVAICCQSGLLKIDEDRLHIILSSFLGATAAFMIHLFKKVPMEALYEGIENVSEDLAIGAQVEAEGQ